MKPFDTDQYRKRTARGTTGNECCLCGRDTAGQDGGVHVPVNHETGDFVTDTQVAELGDAISLFPIGPECVKKWRAEFTATTNRFRRSRGKLICYDVQPPKAAP